MFTSIIFLLSFITCYTLIFLLKKFDKPASFTNHLIVCYIFLQCLGSTAVLPLSLLGIPINLYTISFIYIIFSCGLGFITFKNKQIQSFYFDKADFANFLILAVFMAFVFLRIFSFDIKLSFFSTDMANHFDMAMKVVNTGKLSTMYFAPLNNSIFIHLLEPVFPGVQTYKSMIIAETISNTLTGLMFYVLLSYKKRSFRFQLASPIFTIMFVAGWPLYQFLLGGFVYWGMGVTLFMFGLYLFYLYQDHPSLRKILLLLIAIDIYCILICYMLFTPFVIGVFLACFLVISYNSSQNKQAMKRFLITAFFVCLGGGIILISALYFFFGDFSIFVEYLARDGGIHKEVYRDYVYFIPLLAIICEKVRKGRELNLTYVSFITFSAFTILTCILSLTGIVSPYYYYKLYFILWALVWLLSCDAIDRLIRESQSWIYIYGGFLLFLAIYTFTPIKEKFIEKNFTSGYIAEFPLYSAVGSHLMNPRETMFDDEDYWEVMNYLDENSLAMPLVTDRDYYYWYDTFFRSFHYTSERFQKKVEALPDSFVIDKESAAYHDYINKLLAEYEILFENSFGVILQKVNHTGI